MKRLNRMTQLIQSLAVLLHTMPPTLIDTSRPQVFALLVAGLMTMQVVIALCADTVWQKALSLFVAGGCTAFVAGFIWVFCS